MSLKYTDLVKDLARDHASLGLVTDLMVDGDEDGAWALLQKIIDQAKDRAWAEFHGKAEPEGRTGEVHPMIRSILKANGVR